MSSPWGQKCIATLCAPQVALFPTALAPCGGTTKSLVSNRQAVRAGHRKDEKHLSLSKALSMGRPKAL